MRPLFGIFIKHRHRVNSPQRGALNYQTLIPQKGSGNPSSPFRWLDDVAGDYGSRLMWHLISTAPFDRDLELALIDANGVHAIFFPCRRVLGGWIKAETKTRIDVRPTHWRDWA